MKPEPEMRNPLIIWLFFCSARSGASWLAAAGQRMDRPHGRNEHRPWPRLVAQRKPGLLHLRSGWLPLHLGTAPGLSHQAAGWPAFRCLITSTTHAALCTTFRRRANLRCPPAAAGLFSPTPRLPAISGCWIQRVKGEDASYSNRKVWVLDFSDWSFSPFST